MLLSMSERGDALMRWCLAEGYLMETPAALIQGFVSETRHHGIAIDRLMLTLRTLHPQLAALGWSWETNRGFQESRYPRENRSTPEYIHSPVRPILEELCIHSDTHPGLRGVRPGLHRRIFPVRPLQPQRDRGARARLQPGRGFALTIGRVSRSEQGERCLHV
ncbi:MAG: hypothetical protein AAFV53_06840 [Myxococcota bacterium]